VSLCNFNEYKNKCVDLTQIKKKCKVVHYYDEIGKSYWIFFGDNWKVEIVYNEKVYTICHVTNNINKISFSIDKSLKMIQFMITSDGVKNIVKYKDNQIDDDFLYQ
jgi:hypothetical protein